MAGLSLCATACLGEALANSNCTSSDLVCQCTDESFNLLVSSCISTSCTVREALSAKNATSSQCGISPVVDHSFLPPISVLLGLAGVAVLMRLASRYKTGAKLWWDDLCNFLALLTGGALLGTVVKATNLGFGTDIWAVPPDDITTFFKIALSDFQIYGVCRILIRSSIILFYIRVFSLTQASKPLWATFFANLVIWITWFFISVFQCSPVSYFWTQWDGQHEGWCISANAVAWSGGGVDLAQDLVLLALPFPYLRRLRLGIKNKIAIFIMFAVGALTVALSIVRLTTIPRFTVSVNSTVDAVPIFLWSALELYVGIICACLPSIYPLARPAFSWLVDLLPGQQATPQPRPLEDPNRRRTFTPRDRKKYKPAWDVTTTNVSTTLGGEDDAGTAPYVQINDAELGSLTTVATTGDAKSSASNRELL